MNVTPVDQAPVATAQSLSVTHDASQIIVLSGNDAETPASQLTYAIATGPSHGNLTQNAGSPNTFTYTPNAGYLGPDSFTFTVTDTGNPPGTLSNAKTSTPATVSLTVVDPAPIGVPATYTTREGVPLTVAAAQGVLANDIDTAGDTLTATIVASASHGALVLNSNGSFTYTPTAGYTGSDTFTYLPHGTYVAGSATTVTIVVTAGTSPPTPPPPSHHNGSSGASPLPPSSGFVIVTGQSDSGHCSSDNRDFRHVRDVAAVTPNAPPPAVSAQNVAVTELHASMANAEPGSAYRATVAVHIHVHDGDALDRRDWIDGGKPSDPAAQLHGGGRRDRLPPAAGDTGNFHTARGILPGSQAPDGTSARSCHVRRSFDRRTCRGSLPRNAPRNRLVLAPD